MENRPRARPRDIRELYKRKLAAARLRYIAESQWGTKRYLRMDLLRDLDTAGTYLA